MIRFMRWFGLSACLGWCVCCCFSVAALGLPAGRSYELVSPAYKAGYGVLELKAVADDGAGSVPRVAFTSQGSFGAVPASTAFFSYLAARSPSSWSTGPLDAPSVLSPDGLISDFSGDLSLTLFTGTLAPNTGTAEFEGSEDVFLLRRTTTPDVVANWEVAGVVKVVARKVGENALFIVEEGVSGNLCHIVLSSLEGGALLPEAVDTNESLYDLQSGASGCGGEAGLRMVGLNNEGKVIDLKCEASYGADHFGHRNSNFNAISQDGSEVFFMQKVDPSTGCRDSPSAQLFVRLGGSRTLEVSRPLGPCGERGEVPCPDAQVRAPSFFEGASEDGSRVFFTTTESLVEGDGDGKRDLYMATIGCPVGEAGGCAVTDRQVTSLVQVSRSAVGSEAAEVQGVVRVAPDGSRVYFVARGALSGSNSEGRGPVAGADNMYVYDVGSGKLGFVADLCSGAGLSGEVEDVSCPPSLESGEAVGGKLPRNDTVLWLGLGEAQSNPTGGVLVFASYGQLSRGDNDAAKDVYRYDAAAGSLGRVSEGEAGFDANGNGDEGPVDDATIHRAWVAGLARAYQQREMDRRAVSVDGSRIVFESAEALSPHATNGQVNVYEWHEGSGVLLVSSGSAPTSDCCGVISASGRDIVLKTSQALVSQDGDQVADLYDARLEEGEGFPLPVAARQQCSSDACQGPLTNPAPLLVPGSVSQAAGDNFLPPAKSKRPPSKHKKKTKKKKVRRAHRASDEKRGRAARMHDRAGLATRGGGRR